MRFSLLARRVLRTCSVAIVAVAISPSTPSEDARSVHREPPNVLLVITDQHRYFALESAGNPLLKTPNIDRIGDEGMHFEHAFANSPVCSADRVQLLAGRWPRPDPGGTKLEPGEPTLARFFKDAGYSTSYIGKWHLSKTSTALGFVPPQDRPWWDWFVGHQAMHEYFDAEFYFHNDPTPYVLPGYEPFWQTRFAIKQMRQARARGKPFFTVVSYGPPHDPYKPPGAFNTYLPSAVTVRPNVSPFLSGNWTTRIARYYGQIASLDHAIGGMLDELERLGQADNTIVVLTSDHGAILGSHASLQTSGEKRRPYEEAIRVPLLIRYPGHIRAGQRNDYFVNTVDVFPTLLGLAGVQAGPGVAPCGRNLAPFLRGQADWETTGVFDGFPGLVESSYLGIWTDGPNQPFEKEWRGVVARFREPDGTLEEYTYAVSRKKPGQNGWLLHNTDGPLGIYQLTNWFNDPAHAAEQATLHALAKRHHDTLPPDGDQPGDSFPPFLP